MSETELLREAGRGNEAAFLVLYERHRQAVYRFASRMLGSTALAEDVTQECFMAMLAQADRYQEERASLRTYLCAIARNLSLKQMRRRGVEFAFAEPPDAPGDEDAPTPLKAVLDSELVGHVRQAIASLPPLQREALILFEYEELSLAEIATVVSADTGTIKSRLHRARERLKRCLAPYISSPAADQLHPAVTSIGGARAS
jgi:RNA polymerase sigma-70 factor (ECF subfamily)